VLSIENLDVSIGAARIVRQASLEMRQGEICGIIGRNGAGKTTLLRAVMGHIPAKGRVAYHASDLLAMPAHERARLGLGYMPEDRRLVPHFTVEQNILLPVWSLRLQGHAERLDWIYGLMPEIAKFRARRAQALSGGQQKMVALGRELMAGRSLLLLDEAFEGLAPALARRLGEVVADLKHQGVSALIVDSQERHLQGLLDRSYRIERGEVVPADYR